MVLIHPLDIGCTYYDKKAGLFQSFRRKNYTELKNCI